MTECENTEPRIEPPYPPKRPGRPNRLTPEVASVVVSAVRSGMSVKAAAAVAGVGATSLFRWLAIGREKGRGQYWELWEQITRARSDLMREALQVINAAIAGTLAPKRTVKTITDPVGQRSETTETTFPPDVSAARWLLERKFRDEFASTAKDLKDLKEVIRYLTRIIEANGIIDVGEKTQLETIKQAIE